MGSRVDQQMRRSLKTVSWKLLHRPGGGLLLLELGCDGKGFHIGQHDMRSWHDDQHAPKPGDDWNDDGGMASEPQRHLGLLAGRHSSIAALKFLVALPE